MATKSEQMPTEMVALSALKPHPKNYRKHPPDQVAHIAQSIKEHGVYRNIVTARDLTILAGHGVALGAKAAGLKVVPIVRVDVDANDPRAIKLLTADNELSLRADIDDRLLADLLKQVQEEDVNGLLGTGYDEEMLANLIFVTRPASEVAGMDEAAEWAGLPDYDAPEPPLRLVVYFHTEDDRAKVLDLLDVDSPIKQGAGLTTWWPEEAREDPSSLRFEGGRLHVTQD